MGIGLVDPILPVWQASTRARAGALLFTSYFSITGVAMLVTGCVSSRIGAQARCSRGLALIIVVLRARGRVRRELGEIVGFRAGWGLGNALFISTAVADRRLGRGGIAAR